MTEPALTLASMLPALPELYLTAAICVLLLVDVFAGSRVRGLTATLTLLLLGVGALLTGRFAMVDRAQVLFYGLYVADPLAVFLKLGAFVAVGTSLFYGRAQRERGPPGGGEYYVLATSALLGMCVLISAHNLLTVYLGVELLSLSLYALVAFDRDSGIAAEAAIKYFVLGAMASGALLYGMSMLYGLTGTLDLGKLATLAHDNTSAGLIIGVAFVMVAVAFKFGAVPFHMWVPDVYQGAPSSVTLFIGTAPKIAAFAFTFRLLTYGLSGLPHSWAQMLGALAVLSLLIGNVVAIAQTNLRRMLAYSAIANVGFILLGFVTAGTLGYQAALNYTVVYVLTALGSFGVILVASASGSEMDQLEDYKGLSTRDPMLALLMLILMLSTAGVPPFVGFWAKLWIIQALLGSHQLALAILSVLVSVVGAYYYLRVIWYMYFEAAVERPKGQSGSLPRLVLALNALAVLALGLLPNALLTLCQRLIP